VDVIALTGYALEREPEHGREWAFGVILLIILLAAWFSSGKRH
jgi:hypothetical protein